MGSKKTQNPSRTHNGPHLRLKAAVHVVGHEQEHAELLESDELHVALVALPHLQPLQQRVRVHVRHDAAPLLLPQLARSAKHPLLRHAASDSSTAARKTLREGYFLSHWIINASPEDRQGRNNSYKYLLKKTGGKYKGQIH